MVNGGLQVASKRVKEAKLMRVGWSYEDVLAEKKVFLRPRLPRRMWVEWRITVWCCTMFMKLWRLIGPSSELYRGVSRYSSILASKHDRGMWIHWNDEDTWISKEHSLGNLSVWEQQPIFEVVVILCNIVYQQQANRVSSSTSPQAKTIFEQTKERIEFYNITTLPINHYPHSKMTCPRPLKPIGYTLPKRRLQNRKF